MGVGGTAVGGTAVGGTAVGGTGVEVDEGGVLVGGIGLGIGVGGGGVVDGERVWVAVGPAGGEEEVEVAVPTCPPWAPPEAVGWLLAVTLECGIGVGVAVALTSKAAP